jgi:TolA-binding protein
VRILWPAAALAAALALPGCAGDGALRRDLDALRAEVRSMRAENARLAGQVEGLEVRLDAVAMRLGRTGEAAPAAAAAAAPDDRVVVVPEHLEVVRVAPRAPRAPPVPVAVPLVEPDAARLEALARRGGRELRTEAEADLRAARRLTGLDAAHALEDFASRYPRHPLADDVLLEAASAYEREARPDAVCAVARRVADDYPAGDAMPEALLRLAACEARRGSPDAERRFLTRVVSEFPSTPAARRAGDRLAAITGPAGDAPAGPPARSGP